MQKLGASSIKDMGKVMGELKKNYSDTLDFSKAGAIFKGDIKSKLVYEISKRIFR